MVKSDMESENQWMIEFLGLPGAGKTTLAINTIKYLANNGYVCYDHDSVFKNQHIKNKWGLAFLYVLRNIKLAFHLFFYTLLSSPSNFREKYYSFYRLMMTLKLLVMLESGRKRLNQASIMIFDQGIIQCIWSITSMKGSVKKEVLKKGLAKNCNIIPDIIIYVNIDWSTAAKRINQRGGKCIFDSLSVERTEAFFKSQHNNYTKLLEVLREVKNIKVIVIDGSNDINENIGLLASHIENALEEGKKSNL